MNIRRVKKPFSGFTLIELLAVMLILSIIIAMGVGFFVSTTQSMAVFTRSHHLLVNSQWAVALMSRQLRLASPDSLHLTHNAQCLQFLPLIGNVDKLSPVVRDEVARDKPVVASNRAIGANSTFFRRFYRVGPRAAFCVVDHELRYYQGLSSTVTRMDLTRNYLLMARSVSSADQPFTVIAATAVHNSAVVMALTFEDGDQQLAVAKTVVLANVL
ncbi:MAG: type II secretion system GspH family protein [Cellvibrionaceae bacterium]|nr:type II secretion system GspH family protein [Cellvibrionaceae bacterium]